jgi:hypothetical protein
MICPWPEEVSEHGPNLIIVVCLVIKTTVAVDAVTNCPSRTTFTHSGAKKQKLTNLALQLGNHHAILYLILHDPHTR